MRSKPRTRQLLCERLEDRCLLAGYTFTRIADTGAGLSNFGEAPALNNAGRVAFLADSGSAETGICLYTGDGGKLTTVACETPLGARLDPFPSINAEGTVAFVLTSGQRQSIVAGDGGPLTTVYATQPDTFFTGFAPPSLNDAGVVAFHAGTLAESFPDVVFAGAGGESGAIIDRQDVFGFVRFGDFPSVNNAGTVAYSYGFDSGFFSENAIRTGDGGKPTTLYSDHGGLFRSFGDPVLNDAGTAGFFATLAQGGSGIFAGDGGPVTAIATTGGVFSAFAGAPSLNNAGTAAFLATLRAGGLGIFTGPDAEADKVIATGDGLFGSTVAQLGFFRQGLNDAGQVAFFARLADGSSGIFRADPEGHPGRTAVGLAAAGGDPAGVAVALRSEIRTGSPGRPAEAATPLPPQHVRGTQGEGQGTADPRPAASGGPHATDALFASGHRTRRPDGASAWEVDLPAWELAGQV
jgi:hypothetical protein